jgi:hypothetical protein
MTFVLVLLSSKTPALNSKNVVNPLKNKGILRFAGILLCVTKILAGLCWNFKKV